LRFSEIELYGIPSEIISCNLSEIIILCFFSFFAKSVRNGVVFFIEYRVPPSIISTGGKQGRLQH
jgi:hypothetical protein